VVITAVMSIVFLGKKQYCHHWTSLVTIVSGVAIVGLVGIYATKDESADSSQTPTTVLGIVLLLIAQCFTGGQFVTEEKILSGYYLDPLLVVGLEGFWGCCYYAILLPIFQHIKCDNALCHNGQLENTVTAFQQFGEHPVLIAQSIGIIISIACFNATGVAITKYASAAQRSTVDTCRTFLIWLISMIIGWEVFHALELVGFFMLVFGTIIYNEIYVLPIPLFS